MAMSWGHGGRDLASHLSRGWATARTRAALAPLRPFALRSAAAACPGRPPALDLLCGLAAPACASGPAGLPAATCRPALPVPASSGGPAAAAPAAQAAAAPPLCPAPVWPAPPRARARAVAFGPRAAARGALLSSDAVPTHTASRGSVPAPGARGFSTRSLHGRMFYRRRPRFIPRWSFNRRKKWLEGAPNRKGVCTKVYVEQALKPNSGLRKVCYARLSNGRVVKAYIPGIGHNLQVHSVVMIRGGRKKDVKGCNYVCIRGKYDLLPVKNRRTRRSKYGVPRPPTEPKHKRFKQIVTSVDRRLHYYRTQENIQPDDEPEEQKKLTHPKTKLNYMMRNTNPNYLFRKPRKKRQR